MQGYGSHVVIIESFNLIVHRSAAIVLNISGYISQRNALIAQRGYLGRLGKQSSQR